MIQRSFILETLVYLIVRTALVFSLYMLFSGHNSPGGGFVAGLVFGISLMLEYIAGGREQMHQVLPVRGSTALAFGLSLALLTGLAGFVWGDAFLETTYAEVEVPVLGVVKATSALSFDIGVFAVVAGLVASLITAFGPEEDVA
jgi:multicomponent Na+:H+ antiporter subunit A